MESILVSWLGRTDLRAVSESDQVGIGPIAQALRTGRFAQLDLLCDCSTDEADSYLDWLRLQTDARIIPHPIIHQSQIMQRVVALAHRVALRSIPVLIEGESGTGKELLARAIHQASPRRDRPMITITVNCGAIALELIESELFGHESFCSITPGPETSARC